MIKSYDAWTEFSQQFAKGEVSNEFTGAFVLKNIYLYGKISF